MSPAARRIRDAVLPPDSQPAGQDLGKREVIEQFLDVTSDDVTLLLQLLDLCRHPRDDELDRVCPRHDDRLLGQGFEDLADERAGILAGVVAGHRFTPACPAARGAVGPW